MSLGNIPEGYSKQLGQKTQQNTNQNERINGKRVLYRLSIVFLKAAAAAETETEPEVGEVGVYGGVDTSQHRRHFSSGSSSPPLSVRSSGRPEVTSSRDVTRRSTTVSMSHSQRRRRERRRRRLCPSLAQLSLGWCTSNRSAHAISSCSAALKRTACVSERTHSQSAMSAASVCTSEAYTAMRVEHPPPGQFPGLSIPLLCDGGLIILHKISATNISQQMVIVLHNYYI